MQKLGNNAVSDNQVRAALAAPNITFQTRIEVLSLDYATQGSLTGLLSGSVNHDITQNIKRSLDLTFIKTSDTPTLYPFATLLKVWCGLLVNGTYLREWPQGVFLYTKPSHKLTNTGNPVYAGSFPDFAMFKLYNTRPVSGFTMTADTSAIGALQDIFGKLDIPINVNEWPSGVPASGEYIGTYENTYGEIANEILQPAGFFPPWVDGDGEGRVTPVPIFAYTRADWSYTADRETSIIIDSINFSPSINTLSNRVVVRANNSDTDADMTAVVLADAEHPLSFDKIGYYIDHDVIDDSTAKDESDLIRRGKTALSRSLNEFQKLEVPTRWNPTHESFDIIEFRYPEDQDFALIGKFHETGWSLNLTEATMTHSLTKIESQDDMIFNAK